MDILRDKTKQEAELFSRRLIKKTGYKIYLYGIKNYFWVIFANVCPRQNISLDLALKSIYVCKIAAMCVMLFICQHQSFSCHLL